MYETNFAIEYFSTVVLVAERTFWPYEFSLFLKMNVLVIGCNKSNYEIQLNEIAIIKPDLFINDVNKNEYCLKVYRIVNGVESEFMGYIGREFLPFRNCYENKLAQVIKIYKNSTNSQERKVAVEREGVCLCVLLN